jgi:ABC-2 type transport system permease protein
MLSFFVNPPHATLSGALTPVEAMPKWLQPATVINPTYHFGIITRGVMVKASTFADVWPNFLALIAITIALMTLSVLRFRKQLG